MSKLKIFYLFVSISILSACAYSDEFHEVNHQNQFMIAFPDYMKSCEDFQADLQFKNAYRNTYSIVNAEDKNGRTLAEFQKEKLGVLKTYEMLSKPLVTDSLYRVGDNYKAIDIQLYGVMDEENIYYWHSSFESDGKFYELVCWTRSMDRKQRYGPDLEKIISSFTPLL